nr:hypothetical protein [Candidatus Levybacteria bacterium]
MTSSVIIGSDWGYFFQETMNEWFPIHSLWNPQLNFGYYDFVSAPFLFIFFLRGLLTLLHIDFVFIDRILYLYPIAFITPLSMFYLCYKYTKNLMASFFGSLVYSINTYILTLEIGHFNLAFVYAIFPLLFLTFSSFLDRPRYKQFILFLFLIFLSFTYEARITFIAILILILYFVFRTLFYKGESSFKNIVLLVKYFLLSLIIFIGFLSFLILPLIAVKDMGIGDVAGRGFFGAEFFPIQNAFALFHPFWDGTITTEFVQQPIPFYFWFFPIIAFSSFFYVKKDKKIIFFSVLALIGIFLSKGITDPLGFIYKFLYFNIPGFSFFREPSKFYIIVAFSYSLLFAYFIKYFVDHVNKKINRQSLKLIINIFLFIFISLIFLPIAKPVVNRTLADSFRSTIVPEDYFVLKNYLLSQKDFYRVMYLPNRQRFEFLSSNHPSLSYYDLSEIQRTINPEILKLFSVKYIILPYDSTNDVYRHYAPKEVWERLLKNAGFQKQNRFNLKNIELYENTSGYMPHIYIAEDNILINSDTSLFENIIGFTDNNNSEFYFSQSKENVLMPLSSDVISNFNKILYQFSCIKCKEDKPWEYFAFPYARILPDSPLYSYIKLKEKKELIALENNPKEYAEKVAYFSLKRIIEAQKIVSENMHTQYLEPVLNDNSYLLSILSNLSKRENFLNLENNESLIKLSDYIIIEQKIIRDIVGNEKLYSGYAVSLHRKYYELADFESKINNMIWKSNGNDKKYIINVSNASNYKILVQKKSHIPNFSLFIDNEKILKQGEDEKWIDFGIKTLKNGPHQTIISMDKSDNLIATNSATFITTTTEGIRKIKIPISDFKSGKEINLSFDYLTEQGKSPRFMITGDSDRENNGERETQFDHYLRENNTNWTHENMIIKPKDGATKGDMELWLEADGNRNGIFSIKNLKAEMITNPVILVKEDKKNLIKKPTDIKFKYISQTYYKIDIIEATDPFTLVFNEQFHNGWRAYINSKQIADNRHFEVNGYANAWLINKRGTYSIDIYFYPEQYYFIGIFLSLVTVAAVIISLVMFKRK